MNKLFLLVLLLSLLIISCGKSTTYCPTSHKLRDLSSCEIMLKSDPWILIQHAELDLNKYYFELRNLKTRASSFFALHSEISKLGSAGYEAKLGENLEIYIKLKIKNGEWTKSDGKKLQSHLY